MLVAALLIATPSGGVASARQADPAVTIKADNAAAIARLADTAKRALKELVEWLGPLTTPLTVVDLPWDGGPPGASQPGIAATRVRWIAPDRDLSAERALIAAIARQFWMAPVSARTAPFQEGLVVYSATKTIHRVLEGRNYAAPRFFGGFVPVPIRSLVLSPNQAGRGAPLGDFDEVLHPFDAPWRFASVEDGSPARRADVALRTLERVIGWPAMQQALAAARERAAGGAITPEMFAGVVAEQRGVSVDWFVRDLVRSGDVIDYAVGDVSSEAIDGGRRTTIRIERRGPGVFSGTDQPRSAGAARSLSVLVRFADGTDTRVSVDGRDDHTDVAIDSVSPAMVVGVDPAEFVVIDANRVNNAWTSGAPPDRNGRRLIANWLIWLQNVMLTYSAVA